MFAARMFAPRMFAPRFFPEVGADPAAVTWFNGLTGSMMLLGVGQ